MNPVLDSKRVRDLHRVLEDVAILLEQLGDTIEQKITAMRRADLLGLQAAAERERAAAARIKEREGLRRQLVEALAKSWKSSEGNCRKWTLSEIGGRLPESERIRLGQAAERLRPRLERVSRLNRTAGTVSSAIIGHLQWVFSAVRPKADRPFGYAGDGGTVAAGNLCVLDAVG
jgi:hypothetical protein